jgi:hypothetical protein
MLVTANPSILLYLRFSFSFGVYNTWYFHCSFIKRGVFNLLTFISWTRPVTLSSHELWNSFPPFINIPFQIRTLTLFSLHSSLHLWHVRSEKLRNAPVRFAMSSACNNSRTAGLIFMKFGNIVLNATKICRPIPLLFKIGQQEWTLHDLYAFLRVSRA